MNFFVATLVGAASGILASMGLGGGFVLVVYLVIFTDTIQKGAQGLNLLVFIPITVLAVVLHIKNKLIDVTTALICSAFGVAAAVGGFYLAQALQDDTLRKLFAVFIIIAGLKDLFTKTEPQNELRN